MCNRLSSLWAYLPGISLITSMVCFWVYSTISQSNSEYNSTICRFEKICKIEFEDDEYIGYLNVSIPSEKKVLCEKFYNFLNRSLLEEKLHRKFNETTKCYYNEKKDSVSFSLTSSNLPLVIAIGSLLTFICSTSCYFLCDYLLKRQRDDLYV